MMRSGGCDVMVARAVMRMRWRQGRLGRHRKYGISGAIVAFPGQ